MSEQNGSPQKPREHWGSKLGVILAVSGSAVGLGNFLRFPGQVAGNGGGAFMIPYFISLLLLGIPICWAEWTLGREGGRRGFNSSPGVMYSLTKSKTLRLSSFLAILVPIAILMYYAYIEAWCLGYAWDYLMGNMEDYGHQLSAYEIHFSKFVGKDSNGLTSGTGDQRTVATVVWFVLIVFAINFYLIYRGLTKGIEKFCKVAMPLLIVSAIVIAIRVLTLPQQPIPEPWQFSLQEGLPKTVWSGFVDELTKTRERVDEEAVARMNDAEKWEGSIPLTVADADDEMKADIRSAIETFFRGIKSKTPGYNNTIRVEEPWGYLQSYKGICFALDVLKLPDGGKSHRQWVIESRDKLTSEQKWELLRFESLQESSLAIMATPQPPIEKEAEHADWLAEQEKAKHNIDSLVPEREAILNTLPSKAPGLDKASDKDAFLRGAAAEIAELDRTVTNGMGFMWNPRTPEGGTNIWVALAKPSIWLSAAGQIFFSLSVGFGIIMVYATHVRPKQDIALSGLTSASTNEFCEVCLGGLCTIPAAFIFLGLGKVQGVGTFNLGFITLPTVFAQMPFGRWIGFIWFFMLFLAAITSSLSMIQPAIAFVEESFNIKRKISIALLGLLCGMGTMTVMYFSKGDIGLNTIDFWVGTLCIYVLATIIIILFGWGVGIEKGLSMLNDGAEIHVPKIFGFIMKYVSPVYLLVVFGSWLVLSAPDTVKEMFQDDAAIYVTLFVVAVGLLFAVLVVMAFSNWDKNRSEKEEVSQ